MGNRTRLSKMINKLHFFISIFLLIIIITGCTTLRENNIEYNQAKESYEYRINTISTLPLRNENLEIVNKQNYDSFLLNLKSKNYQYSFKKKLENDNYIKVSDYFLSKLYSEITIDILNFKYNQGIEKTRLIRNIYPDVLKYSDLLFLEGFMYEKLGNHDSTIKKYNDFLRLSSGKYSSRFRGYKNSDVNDTIFKYNRQYAKNYLNKITSNYDVSNFQIINPKYFYQSFLPGYNLNQEDEPKHIKGSIMLYFGPDYSNNLTYGIQCYYNLYKWIGGNVRISANKWLLDYCLAMPLQVYKTKNNQFGVKISPVITYTSIDSILVDSKKYKAKESIINYGLKISAGYFLYPNIMIGGYYQYLNYNENNKYTLRNLPVQLWWKNEYDLSLYYNILKNFSIKGGVKNNNIMFGVFWTGWELNINLTKLGLYSKIDMY